MTLNFSVRIKSLLRAQNATKNKNKIGLRLAYNNGNNNYMKLHAAFTQSQEYLHYECCTFYACLSKYGMLCMHRLYALAEMSNWIAENFAFKSTHSGECRVWNGSTTPHTINRIMFSNCISGTTRCVCTLYNRINKMRRWRWRRVEQSNNYRPNCADCAKEQAKASHLVQWWHHIQKLQMRIHMQANVWKKR